MWVNNEFGKDGRDVIVQYLKDRGNGLAAEHIRALHRAGTTIVLVEHNLGVVMRLCPRLVVLAQGRVVTDGPPEVVRQNPGVVAAYFGSEAPV